MRGRDGLHEVERAEGPSADEGFAGGEVGGGAGEHGGAADAVEDVGLAGRKLRLVAADGGDFLLQRLADIDREVARIAAERFGLEGEAEIELRLDRRGPAGCRNARPTWSAGNRTRRRR